jgi:hypothetical protein
LRPEFLDGLFQLENAELRAGYHFRQHQQVAVTDRNSRPKDEQELAARESQNPI